jgi:hypothetical protein
VVAAVMGMAAATMTVATVETTAPLH